MWVMEINASRKYVNQWSLLVLCRDVSQLQYTFYIELRQNIIES